MGGIGSDGTSREGDDPAWVPIPQELYNLCSHSVLAWCTLVRNACDSFSDPLLVDLAVHRATAWGLISVVPWGWRERC